MKKSLVALAVLAASGAAMAQSSVTMFGVLDVGIGHNSGSNQSVTGLTNGGLSTSRLGFRGVEDLGGGLRAGFWLEGGLNPDTGDGKKNGATSGGLEFKRRSTVSLIGANWGEVRLGRDNAASYTNLLTFDPFGATGSGTLFKGNINGIDDRKNNTLSYFLPSNLGGFYGQVQYILGEKAAGTTDSGDGYGVQGGYANGPLKVGAHYLKIKKGAMSDNAVALTQDAETYGIGATYDFGIVKPFALWNEEKSKAVGSLSEVKYQSYLIGLTAPLGNGEVRFSYNDLDLKNSKNDSKKYAVGYVYNLSKRTALYGTYAHISNDGVATRKVAAGGLTSPSLTAGDSGDAYEFGIRHSF